MAPDQPRKSLQPTPSPPYFGQHAVLATMHGKQDLISPTFLAALGLIVETASGLDTDALGTFTGETPRAGSMKDAAIAKARLGMAATGLPVGIASEGSYGPHPSIPFVAGGIELMVLVDNTRNIVIVEQLIEDAPVYGHTVVACTSELDRFLQSHRFPEHALIVKPNVTMDQRAPLRKGLRDIESLADAVTQAASISADRKALVQTDMRAFANPTRMASIARLADKFATRIANLCPRCHAPGHGQVDVALGLPCAVCHTPTDLVDHTIHGCVACAHGETRPRPDGRRLADPAHCPRCNP